MKPTSDLPEYDADSAGFNGRGSLLVALIGPGLAARVARSSALTRGSVESADGEEGGAVSTYGSCWVNAHGSY
jgi:hypothetical protein